MTVLPLSWSRQNQLSAVITNYTNHYENSCAIENKKSMNYYHIESNHNLVLLSTIYIYIYTIYQYIYMYIIIIYICNMSIYNVHIYNMYIYDMCILYVYIIYNLLVDWEFLRFLRPTVVHLRPSARCFHGACVANDLYVVFGAGHRRRHAMPIVLWEVCAVTKGLKKRRYKWAYNDL